MLVELGARRLRYFIAVAEELSFTRAATRVFISQQALSQHVQRLEHDLGVSLLVRSTQRVALTSAGQILLDEARRLVAENDAAVQRVRRAAAGTSGVLRIGFVADGMLEAVRPVLAGFEKIHPEIEIQLVEESWADHLTGLRSGIHDAGLVALPNGQSGLEIAPISTWSPCVVQSKTHPLTTETSLSVNDLRGMPTVWYDVPAESFYTRWNVGEPAVRATTPLAWLAAVASGRAVGVISSAVRDAYVLADVDFGMPDFDYLPVTGLPDMTIALAACAEDPNPVVRELLDHARTHASGQGSLVEIRRSRP